MTDSPEDQATEWITTPRARLAAAVRRVTTVTVGRPIADWDLIAATEAVEQVAATLEAAAEPGKIPRILPNLGGGPQGFFSTSPATGYENPIAPPVHIWAATGPEGQLEVRGRATFGYAYEGPPTCVHGGVIAEVFDEMLGVTNIASGVSGMTGTLTVRYIRPTPLMVEVDLVARQRSVEGRKIVTWGGIYHHGELTAEAEGLFIVVDPAKMADIVRSNAAEAPAAVVDDALLVVLDNGGDVLAAE